jgi:hypothetical protein
MNNKNEIYDAVLVSAILSLVYWVNTGELANLLFVWPSAYCLGTGLVFIANIWSYESYLEQQDLKTREEYQKLHMVILSRMKWICLYMVLAPIAAVVCYVLVRGFVSWIPFLGPKSGIVFLAICMALWTTLFNRYNDEVEALSIG